MPETCRRLMLLVAALHLVALANVACLGEPVREVPLRHEGPITVMTFNVRHGLAVNDGLNQWIFRRDLVTLVVEEEAPAIIGFQEAHPFQLHYLQDHLPDYESYGVGREANGKGEMVPLFWDRERFERLETGTFWFSNTPEKPGSNDWDNAHPRICSWARLLDRSTQRSLYVYNLHLSTASDEVRERSAVMLLEMIVARDFPEDTVLVLGDFNAAEDSPAISVLDSAELGEDVVLYDTYRRLYPEVPSTRTGHAFSGGTEGKKIDYIFASSDFTATASDIITRSYDGRYPSDHFPVVATLTW
ncbi:MAG: hypothetical protein A2284_08755 [Deltaproteobacteria bacterium RIFOXYA12_FULL_61_11]|nr:MAG: hypothetical protein A2284_08755 [Deltaproteobacteria bacterium RIFOXYA12_FULL_61_11]